MPNTSRAVAALASVALGALGARPAAAQQPQQIQIDGGVPPRGVMRPSVDTKLGIVPKAQPPFTAAGLRVAGVQLRGPDGGRWEVRVTVTPPTRSRGKEVNATLTCLVPAGPRQTVGVVVPVAFGAEPRETTFTARSPVVPALAPGAYLFQCSDGQGPVFVGTMRVT